TRCCSSDSSHLLVTATAPSGFSPLSLHDALPIWVLGHLGRGGGVDADIEELYDEHAEGGAPVTDVVLADDRVAEEFVGAGQGVADDGGAQVADVHLLGHVRRRVVDGHRL